MPAGGKKYASTPTVKVPASPTPGSSGTVKSGKLTASSYGPYKTQGTISLTRKAK